MPHILYTRFQSLPEGQLQGFYPGVLIIEQGPAKGHYAVKDSGRVVAVEYASEEALKGDRYQITIGAEALDDVVKCAGESPDGIKCKLDHGSTVRDIVGKYTNFRRDGDQVRADLTLMKSTPHGAYVEELIAEMANKIGNSIDFIPSYEIKGDIAVARCRKLNSVDIVDSPAATNSLYEEKPNQPEPEYMPLTAEDLAAIGGVIDTRLSTHETKLNKRFEEVKENMAEVKKKMEEGDDEDDDDDDKKKKKKDDEDKKDEEMSAKAEKAALAAIEKVLPRAKLESLASLANNQPGKDEYGEKVALSKAAGIPDGRIARHIAATWPQVYNAKFGAKTEKATA